MAFQTLGSRLILLAFLLQFAGWFAFLVVPLGEGIAIGGGDLMITLSDTSMLFPLLAGPAGTVAFLFEVVGKRRRSALIECAVAAALGFGIFQVQLRSAWPLKRLGFERMTERAQPLVSAIEAYQMKYGTPPPTLDALVPEFLPAVRGTGMRGCPTFHYLRKADGHFNPLGPVEADWELFTYCGNVAGFDQIFYWPEGNYPTEPTRGGNIERIGDWAYVHE